MLSLYPCTSIFSIDNFLSKIFSVIGHIEVSHAYLGRANIETMVCKQKHMSDI